MSILHLTLCSALVAMASAAAGPECWYTDPPALCDHTLNSDSETVKDIPDDKLTLEAQMEWCQAECVTQDTDADVATPACKHFTVRTVRAGKKECYLMEDCIKNTGDDCLSDPLDLTDGLCGSGRGDCAANTGCPALTQPSGDEIRWVCDHVDNPYDADKEIPEGADCVLSCEGWVTADGTAVTVSSTCEDDGSNTDTIGWSTTAIMNGVDAADVPALPGTLPQPDDALNQIFCGCGPMPMAWTNTDSGNVINYDPNTLPGTTFICENGDFIIEDPAEAGQAAFIIAEDMTCRLYCDGYHVATMECLNGDWTGEPELGAWCYYEPTADDEIGAYVPQTL